MESQAPVSGGDSEEQAALRAIEQRLEERDTRELWHWPDVLIFAVALACTALIHWQFPQIAGYERWRDQGMRLLAAFLIFWLPLYGLRRALAKRYGNAKRLPASADAESVSAHHASNSSTVGVASDETTRRGSSAAQALSEDAAIRRANASWEGPDALKRKLEQIGRMFGR